MLCIPGSYERKINVSFTQPRIFLLYVCKRNGAAAAAVQAPARLRDFALCWMFFSLASTGFLEHLTMPTDGALSTKCLQTPCQ